MPLVPGYNYKVIPGDYLRALRFYKKYIQKLKRRGQNRFTSGGQKYFDAFQMFPEIAQGITKIVG